MKNKLKCEGKVMLANKVGEKRLLVENKVLKVATIILVHMQPIDGRGKAEIEDMFHKIKALLLEQGITTNTIK